MNLRPNSILLFCVPVLLLVACGSSKKSTPPDTQTAVAQGQATVTGDVPPLPMLTDPESIALVDQHGKIFNFNMSLPEDWKPGESANGNGLDLFNVPNPNGTGPTGNPLLAGYVSVECGAPKPPPNTSEYTSLALATAAAVTMNGTAGTGPKLGQADEGSIHDVQVGSLTGATLMSSIKLGPLTGRVDHVYIATPKCAWHVALSIYSPGDEAPYFALFDRIVQTFRPEGAA